METATAELREFCAAAAPAPPPRVVAVLSFPRVEDRQAALAAGAAAVLGQPWQAEDLVEALANAGGVAPRTPWRPQPPLSVCARQ
jgi:CheY-like chemotaxis protein